MSVKMHPVGLRQEQSWHKVEVNGIKYRNMFINMQCAVFRRAFGQNSPFFVLLFVILPVSLWFLYFWTVFDMLKLKK